MIDIKSPTKASKAKATMDKIFEYAISEKIPEITMIPRKDEIIVYYNTNGVIHRAAVLNIKMLQEIISYIISNSHNISYRKSVRQRVMSMKKNGHVIIAKITIKPHTFGKKINIKLSKKKERLKNLDDVGFTNDDIKKLKNNLDKKDGIILIIGPKRSGKTTTLYSLLKELDEQQKNIHTMEGVTHTKLNGINQHNTYKDETQQISMLSELLKQDIDIIALDEIKYKKEADLISMASSSGALIITTLKDSAQNTISNNILPHLLSGKINCIIRQVIARKICDNCITEDKKTKEEIDKISKKINTYNLDGIKNTRFYRGDGCKKCNNSGHAENIVINDIIEITPKILREIERGADYYKIYKISRKNGKTDIIDNGINLANKGIIKIDDLTNAL